MPRGDGTGPRGKGPMTGLKGGYTPRAAGFGRQNNGMPRGTMVNKGNGFPGRGVDGRHGSYTPAAGWSGVVGKK